MLAAKKAKIPLLMNTIKIYRYFFALITAFTATYLRLVSSEYIKYVQTT